jgi:RNA polymerase sigma factor (sigma-70 family)
MGAPSPKEPEAQLIQRIEEQEVINALDHLSSSDREIIRLAYWEELPHADIGAILGCSAGAVDTRVHRAVRRIGKELLSPGHKRSERQIVSPGDEKR